MARTRVLNVIRRCIPDRITDAARARLATYLRDKRGAVAIIYSLALPALVGMVGLGVETGYWYVSKRNLQTEADAAALGAGWKDMFGGSAGDVLVAATNEAERNGFVDTPGSDIAVNNPPLHGAYAGDASATEVVLTEDHELLFASVVRDAVVTVAARAVVDVQPAEDACVLALDTTASKALNVSGNTTVNMPDCVLATNSTYCPDAANVQGSATLTAYSVWSAGCYSNTSSNPVTLTQAAASHAPPIDDPYANATIPTAPNACTPWGGAPTKLSGKKYCANLTINNNETVNFQPGIYWFDSADLTVNGGGTLHCTSCSVGGNGVVIIFQKNGANVGSVTINGNANVTLNGLSATQATALGAPSLSGLLFFQDPSAATSSSDKAVINGGSGTSLVGATYFRNNKVEFSGNTNNQSACTMVIGKTVEFTGNSKMNVGSCADYGVNIPKTMSIALVE